jgi:hypothetical protein
VTPDLPAMLFVDDLARVLRMSRRSIERMRRQRVFPIPEIHSLDSRPRWSRTAVEHFLATSGEQQPVLRRRRA